MAARIDSITPKPTEVNLLTSADPLPENRRAYNEWSQGIEGRNVGGLGAYSEGMICPDPDREAYSPTDHGCHTFYPLKTKLPHGTSGQNIDDEDRWEQEAEAAIRQKLPYRVARELWTGRETNSASFQSTTTAVSTSSALGPVAGISAALADYEDCTQGAEAFIHAPSVLTGHLSTQGFIDRDGDKLRTIDRHILVPGPGYPNSAGPWGPYDGPRPEDPDDLPDWYASGQEADDGQVWVYVTGHVETAEHFLAPHTQWWDRLNEFRVTSTGVTIARYDTDCVFAALVTVPGAA